VNKYIAPFILRTEYQCPCCHLLPPDFYKNGKIEVPDVYWELFNTFKFIREEWGALPISSGYRCPKYNHQIGGVLGSVHTAGLAIDVDCNFNEVDRLHRVIVNINPQLRIGKYKKAGTFIHCDIGYRIRPRLSKKWVEGKRWTG